MQCEIDTPLQAWLDTPDEAVYLERARILHDAMRHHAALPPGRRQGETIVDLCQRISLPVGHGDVLLGRVHEQLPTADDEAFIRQHPELFLAAGVPGWLDSASIYVPDWARLLEQGLGGLLADVERRQRQLPGAGRDAEVRGEWLEGVRLSLVGISRLVERYAAEARRLADASADASTAAAVLEAADACAAVAAAPPATLRQALQLFVLYHMVLSCVVGGRNVTPGRMDQYLLRFYERDLADGRLTRPQAVGLLAEMMRRLSQLTGQVATDFQSTKRSPNRYAHHYITLGGVDADGASAVNPLSLAFLDARRRVRHREPSLSIRHFPGIDPAFWRQAVAVLRDRLPAFAYNDRAVVPALVRCGIAERLARDYAHCACLACVVPGHGLPAARDNYNLPLLLLRAIGDGPAELKTFELFFDAFRREVEGELRRRFPTGPHAAGPARPVYPLPAWPLFHGHLDALHDYSRAQTQYRDQHVVGLATTLDSLRAIDQAVYRDKRLPLAELAEALDENFAGREPLRLYLQNAVPRYGSDEAGVVALTRRVGRLWADEVARANQGLDHTVLRPGFHSWLYNLDQGRATPATPDGRQAGEPLSADHLPAPGRPLAPTDTLRAMALLPHDHTCSGGATLPLMASHFGGEAGLDRLRALIDTYFDQGGLQLHFILADTATLRDAMAHPDRHRELLVRVTGFSEYFVRLLPEVQEELIHRLTAAE